ncbi:MAG TPA: antitoxin family protein [Phycisphaerae bacterium]|nr:antitoxin family protein [Phycisphaerae bacterium]
MVVKAIYENGVFKPTEKVTLPEHTHVEFEPRITEEAASEPALEGVNLTPQGMDKIYEILGMRFNDPNSPGNLAERHNEHQP